MLTSDGSHSTKDTRPGVVAQDSIGYGSEITNG